MHALHAAMEVAEAIADRKPVTSPSQITQIVDTQSATHATFGANHEPETELAVLKNFLGSCE
jgi:hypothetical protein